MVSGLGCICSGFHVYRAWKVQGLGFGGVRVLPKGTNDVVFKAAFLSQDFLGLQGSEFNFEVLD